MNAHTAKTALDLLDGCENRANEMLDSWRQVERGEERMEVGFRKSREFKIELDRVRSLLQFILTVEKKSNDQNR